MVDHTGDNDNSPKRRKNDHARLESWKSIANYLNRSVRTVRRWEADGGLPVRRHKHGKGSSIYAYQVELDVWLARHHDCEDLVTRHHHDAKFQGGRTGVALWKIAAACVLAFGAGLIAHDVFFLGAFTPESGSAQSLESDESSAAWIRSTAGTLVAPVFELWSDGRIQESLQASLDLQHRLRNVPEEVRENVAALLVHHAISLGRIDDATVITEAINDADHRAELHAAILFASGRKDEMREELERIGSLKHESTAVLMAMAGLTDKALAGIAQLNVGGEQRLRSLVIHGIAAMQAGDLAAARSRLDVAALTLDVEDQAFFFVALDLLSGLHVKAGDVGLAIEVLEGTMDKRKRAASGGSGIFWLMCQWQLARLYAEEERAADAKRIDVERRHFMSIANESFPLANAQLET
jgi:hypothetical protein